MWFLIFTDILCFIVFGEEIFREMKKKKHIYYKMLYIQLFIRPLFFYKTFMEKERW